MRIQAISAVIALTAAAALADATVDQKMQFHFTGPLGMVNALGGKATHEGIISSTAIKGNRKMTRTDDHGQLIDLDAEKVYTIDFGRKTYTVMTFEEMRKKFEESQQRAEKSSERRSKSDEKNAPEWEVEFSLKSTGKSETINGWPTHEELAIVTVHEKGKTLEQSGGFVLTNDMWMGPKVAAMKELADFERRYVQKVYGSTFDAEMVKLAAAMTVQPGFAKAMKEMAAHRGKFEGTPIRTTMTFETVAGPATQQAESNDSSTSPAAAVFGGLMKRARERRAEKESGGAPGRSTMLDSLTELTKATTSAAAADVTIPADFKQR
jgi:hypothetical protein